MHTHPFKILMIGIMVLSALLLPVSCAPGAPAPAFDILPALKDLKLSGRLVFIVLEENGPQLVALDLASGKTQVLFTGAAHSWLNSADVSPDGKQILLAYALPPANNEINFGFTDLDLMPAAGGKAPTPLLVRFNQNESFFQPTWSPDGKFIYYSHNAPDSSVPSGVKTWIERAVPGSEPQPLLEDAMWPRLSPDGTKLLYHSLKNVDRDNDLFWANVDGSNPKHAIPSDQPVIVDAMLFAPDGRSIYFSMAQSQSFQQPAQQEQRAPADIWPSFSLFLGAKPVSAHNIPSDFYRVSLDGGSIQQVTHMADTGMYAVFSPDGQWLAVISQKGVFVMKPDGSQAAQIASLAAFGSVDWVK